MQVSIHAPAWGATHDIRQHIIRWQGFNPRTRVGCDQLWYTKYSFILMFQSTHPRGVRPRMYRHSIRHVSFNPRTRVGCDRQAAHRSSLTYLFQSTHPRGVRRWAQSLGLVAV